MDRYEVIGPAYGPVQEHSTSNSALASLPRITIPKGAKTRQQCIHHFANFSSELSCPALSEMLQTSIMSPKNVRRQSKVYPLITKDR